MAPNVISGASLLFSALAGICLLLGAGGASGRAPLLLAAAGLVQLRLLCNLLDGMVAIEGGRRTRYGELFNELPDRASDIVILVCAGYAVGWEAWGPGLGWAAAVVAVLTAYLRFVGGALTGVQHFTGPMAKAHRMAVLTVALLLQALQAARGRPSAALPAALAVIVAGGLLTLVARARRILADLAPRPPPG